MEHLPQAAEARQARQQSIAAEERLRREISELLHSRVQSKLLVVWHRLGDALKLMESDPTSAAALVREVRDEVDRIREQDVRQASHLLHPSIIRVGLVPAVRSLATRYEDYYRILIDVDPAVAELDRPASNRIPPPVRLASYRVIEEALSNVQRHARAGLVEIVIELTADDCLAVVVRDDGVGFDPAALKPGLGLTSIAGRVEQFDGTWEISGRAGEGTTLRACFRASFVDSPAGTAEPL